jgi:hypothetical protein
MPWQDSVFALDCSRAEENVTHNSIIHDSHQGQQVRAVLAQLVHDIGLLRLAERE